MTAFVGTVAVLIALFGMAQADLSNEYVNMEQLSPEYKFYWNISDSRIFIAVEVNATGWVALGFAEKIGNMKDYDVGMGYILTDRTPNDVELKDCHTDGHKTPPVDQIQDLKLTAYSQVGGVTTLQYHRSLTGDGSDDVTVKSGPMNVVWAFSNADSLNIKHTKKGWKKLTLMSGARQGVALTRMGIVFLIFLAGLTTWIA